MIAICTSLERVLLHPVSLITALYHPCLFSDTSSTRTFSKLYTKYVRACLAREHCYFKPYSRDLYKAETIHPRKIFCSTTYLETKIIKKRDEGATKITRPISYY
jgi:hypothetical protein